MRVSAVLLARECLLGAGLVSLPLTKSMCELRFGVLPSWHLRSRTVRKIAYQPTNSGRPGVRGVRDRPTDSRPAGRAGGLAGPLRRLPNKASKFQPEAPRAPRRPMMEAVPESSTLPSSGVVVPTTGAPGIRSIWGDHIGTSSAKSLCCSKSAGPTDRPLATRCAAFTPPTNRPWGASARPKVPTW